MNNLQKKVVKHLFRINQKQKQILIDMVSKINLGTSPPPGWELGLMNDIEDIEEWLNAVIKDEEIK